MELQRKRQGRSISAEDDWSPSQQLCERILAVNRRIPPENLSYKMKLQRANLNCKAKVRERIWAAKQKIFLATLSVEMKDSASLFELRSERFRKRIWAVKRKISRANWSYRAKDSTSKFELLSERFCEWIWASKRKAPWEFELQNESFRERIWAAKQKILRANLSCETNDVATN